MALGMVAFFGFLGLVLDGAGAYLEQQNLQKAADLAAMSGTWAFYHATYKESDTYGTPNAGMQAATAAIRTTLNSNGYASVTPTTTFIDATGADLPGGCLPGGTCTTPCPPAGASPPCPQPWEVRGVHLVLSVVRPNRILQAVGVGDPTIGAAATAELAPNTGAQHEAPLLLQNYTSPAINLPRVSGYPTCAPNPADGVRYSMTTDCRPSTRRPWPAQPLTLEPGWDSPGQPVLSPPFDTAPVTNFLLLHDPATQQPPAYPAKQQTVEFGLAEFLPTCPANVAGCAGGTQVYADTTFPLATDPVPAGMQNRVNKAGIGSQWAGQACSDPHNATTPLTPDNPRLIRLPVTYAAGPNGGGGFYVSETVMFCVQSVPVDGGTGSYAVSGYLVEEPSADPTVLSKADPYFGRDVVVKLLS